MSMEIKKNILEWLSKEQKDIIEISEKIWRYAELAMQEKKSSMTLCNWLSKEGFRVETGTSGMPTAFLAEFSLGSGSPVIAFLTEYDAIPRISNKVAPWREPMVKGDPGHGCGHPQICTGNTAAAIAVKNEMKKLGIDGTIRVYGGPAEELLIGKVFMARDGLFDDCDVILTSHPTYVNAANANACCSLLSTEFTFFGESCLVSTSPESGRNALDAAQLANVASSMRKNYMARGTVVEYVIPEGGFYPNVVPDVAKIWYMVRHPNVNCVKDAYQKIVDAVKGAAIATGTTSEERFLTFCYGYLPNERLGKLIYDNAKMVRPPIFSNEEKLFANELRKNYGLEAREEPIHEGIEFQKGGLDMYAQDGGDASWISPLASVNCAFPIGIPRHGWGITAVSGSSIAHKGMMFCARTLGATAADILTLPEVVEEIKKEHRERTKGFEYKCLVPDNVKPITEDFVKHHVKTRW
jgi:aminobenzoyl-glutamate utilization protein B